MALPSPDRAKGWTDYLLTMTERGGPVLSLVLLVLGAFLVWRCMAALEHRQHRIESIHQELNACYEQRVAEALRCHERP